MLTPALDTPHPANHRSPGNGKEDAYPVHGKGPASAAALHPAVDQSAAYPSREHALCCDWYPHRDALLETQALH